MNPETGTFHPIADDVAAVAEQIASGEIGKDLPTFAVGEIVDIKGYKFMVLRINVSSLVVQPIPIKGIEGSRNLMRAMTGGGA